MTAASALSPVVQLGWQIAAQETGNAKKKVIGPVQMFCGLSKVNELLDHPDCVPQLLSAELHANSHKEFRQVEAVFNRVGIDLNALRRTLRAKAGLGTHDFKAGEVVHRSEALKAFFDRAAIIAGDSGKSEIEMAHLLSAMFEDANGALAATLIEQGCNLANLRAGFLGNDLRAAATLADERTRVQGESSPQSVRSGTSTPFLDRFGRDLTALARVGALGPVVGRRNELLQVMQTLMRRTKCNPVLVGEPGVGKTSVVELLALRIASNEVEGAFVGSRLVEISVASLVAGASHAGQREQRFESVLAEARANPSLILFIDEIHTLMKAGGVGGSIDPADIFKPALARGEIRCIGATTHEEYARYIEADSALERRFARIVVDEPTSEETFAILAGIRPSLERHHGVRFPDETLRAAVELSVRFDADHQLPDKAIDLLDLAAARTRMPTLSLMGGREPVANAAQIVSREAVAIVLAKKLSIPLAFVQRDFGSNKTAGIKEYLRSRVIGQEAAVERIAARIELAHANLRPRRGARCTLLLLGPTGVGKTETARALAHFLFGDERSLIRFDMSEYAEAHSVSRLVGAPPGYAGYGEPGQLTDALRAKPYSVVLLDEIDKAHPRVFDLFLQLFDDGRLTDSRGRTVDGRHAIFVLTANPVNQGQPIGFGHDATRQSQAALDALKAHVRPEFLNRIGEQIYFQPLTRAVIRALIEKNLRDVAHNVQQQAQRQVMFDADVIDHLVNHGYSAADGARHALHAIERLIDAPLARALGNSTDQPANASLVAVVRDDRIEFHWRVERS